MAHLSGSFAIDCEVFLTVRALGQRGTTIPLVAQNVAVSLEISQRAYVSSRPAASCEGHRRRGARQRARPPGLSRQ
jgi:ABC-type branched-subunit amino acid transport system ATPase component